MKIEYTLTIEDYKAALRLHIEQKPSRRLRFFLLYIAVPVLAAAGLLVFVFFDVHRLTRYAAIFFGVECALIWVALYFPLYQMYAIRKCFKQLSPPSAKDRLVSFEADENQIVSVLSDVSEGRFSWKAVHCFAQNEKVTLIYFARIRFLFFPTSALTLSQRAELNDLVARHVVKR